MIEIKKVIYTGREMHMLDVSWLLFRMDGK